MKNLKISFKLLLSFGGIALVILLLSVLSLVSLGGINQIVTEYKEEILLSTNSIWDIRNKMVLVELYLAEAISSDNDLEIQAMVQEAVSERQALQVSIDQFKAFYDNDSVFLKEYESKLAIAGKYRESIIEVLGRPHSDDNAHEALHIFQDQFLPAYTDANSALISLADEVESLSVAQSMKAENTWGTTKTLVFFAAAFAVFFAAIMGWLLQRSILLPVRELEQAARDMAEGNLNTEITYQSGDELGGLADSFRRSGKTIRAYIWDIDRAMKEMSGGNFDLQPTQPFIGDFKQIEDSIGSMIANISQELSKVDLASSQVLSGADQISDSAQILAQGATEQASAVEELLAAVCSVSENFGLNAQHTQQASTLASEATDSIQSSNEQMQQLIASINNVNSMSQDISKITKVIEDIAFQTNILSLNAAVEAARAGEAGKGFAVVASEVRNLAMKSAEAAKMTSDLIRNSVEVIDTSVVQTESTASLLNGAVRSVTDTMTIIGEISAATAAQIEVIKQINTGLDQISSVIQTNSASSEESAASSKELANQAALLKEITGSFQLKRLV